MNNSLLDLGALPSELTASGFTKSPKRLALGRSDRYHDEKVCSVLDESIAEPSCKKVDLITE